MLRHALAFLAWWAGENPGRPGHHPSPSLRNASCQGCAGKTCTAHRPGLAVEQRSLGSCPGPQAQHGRGGLEEASSKLHGPWGRGLAPACWCWGPAGVIGRPRGGKGRAPPPAHSRVSNPQESGRGQGSSSPGPLPLCRLLWCFNVSFHPHDVAVHSNAVLTPFSPGSSTGIPYSCLTAWARMSRGALSRQSTDKHPHVTPNRTLRVHHSRHRFEGRAPYQPGNFPLALFF